MTKVVVPVDGSKCKASIQEVRKRIKENKKKVRNAIKTKVKVF